MSKLKYTQPAAPTAFEGAEVRFTIHADRVVGASLTAFYGDGSGSQVGQKRVDWDDMSADEQNCLTTFAGLIAGEVEAEGYEKDPHTRRKEEREAAAQAEADRKAQEKAEREAAEAAAAEEAKPKGKGKKDKDAPVDVPVG